jgi:membrane-bound ClpP family serine protease
MDKRNFAFDRMNFILVAVGMAIVIIGFLLMSGGGTEDGSFNPEIFSPLRIKVAPAVCFIGFVSIVYAIIRKPKDNATDDIDNAKE